MSAYIKDGPLDWELSVDDDGFFTYDLQLLVYCTATTDGPLVALNAPGAPQPGDSWSVDGNVHTDCRRTNRVKVKRHEAKKGDPHHWYAIDYTFTNRVGNRGTDRCNDTQTSNPLAEPPKISGSFTKFTEEGQYDRFGNAIENSAHEPFRGPQNEWDNNRPTVKIKMNINALALALWSGFMDCVNDRPLWGAGVRCVKLSHVSWDIQFYGKCIKYVSVEFEFELNKATWDRDLLDEATKVLNGKWNATTGKWDLKALGVEDTFPFTVIMPDVSNPSHFIRATGKDGNPMKIVLNGNGVPYDPDPLPYTLECGGQRYSPVFTVEGLTPAGFVTPQVGTGTNYGEHVDHSILCKWSGTTTNQSADAVSSGQSTATFEYKLFYDAPSDCWIFKRRRTSGSNFNEYEDALGGATPGAPYSQIQPGVGEGIWTCPTFEGYIAGKVNVFTATFFTTDDPANGNRQGPPLPASIKVIVPSVDKPGHMRVEKYPSVNLLLLGVPAVLG